MVYGAAKKSLGKTEYPQALLFSSKWKGSQGGTTAHWDPYHSGKEDMRIQPEARTEAQRTVLNIVIPADVTAMASVRAAVTQILADKQWPNEDVMNIDLVVQEALANAICHGCDNDPGKQVYFHIKLDAAGNLDIVVTDPGPGFDVTAVPDPLEGGNLLKSSGRGLFLLRKLMDHVEFAEQGRQVRMRKRWAPRFQLAAV
jgi:serine/threonine-protein kinase RsbW